MTWCVHIQHVVCTLYTTCGVYIIYNMWCVHYIQHVVCTHTQHVDTDMHQWITQLLKGVFVSLLTFETPAFKCLLFILYGNFKHRTTNNYKSSFLSYNGKTISQDAGGTGEVSENVITYTDSVDGLGWVDDDAILLQLHSIDLHLALICNQHPLCRQVSDRDVRVRQMVTHHTVDLKQHISNLQQLKVARSPFS